MRLARMKWLLSVYFQNALGACFCNRPPLPIPPQNVGDASDFYGERWPEGGGTDMSNRGRDPDCRSGLPEKKLGQQLPTQNC